MAKGPRNQATDDQTIEDRAEDRTIETVIDDNFDAGDTAAAAAKAAEDLANKPAGDGEKKEPPAKPIDPRDQIARNARAVRDAERAEAKAFNQKIDNPDKQDEPAGDDKPAAAAQPQKVKVNIAGKDEEVTLDELTRAYQRTRATGDRYDEAGVLLNSVKQIAAEAGETVNSGDNRQKATEDARGDQGATDKTRQGGKPSLFSDEELIEFIDAAQTGTQAEAIDKTRALLQKVVERNPGLTKEEVAGVYLEIEQGKADKQALDDFVKANPSLATEPAFQAAAISLAHREMVQDLLKVGLTPDYLRQHANSAPKLTGLHKLYRQKGAQGMRTQAQILSAVGETDQFKRMMGRNPAPKVDKDIIDQGTQRKETLQTQPAARSQPMSRNAQMRDDAHLSSVQRAIQAAQKSRGQTVVPAS